MTISAFTGNEKRSRSMIVHAPGFKESADFADANLLSQISGDYVSHLLPKTEESSYYDEQPTVDRSHAAGLIKYSNLIVSGQKSDEDFWLPKSERPSRSRAEDEFGYVMKADDIQAFVKLASKISQQRTEFTPQSNKIIMPVERPFVGISLAESGFFLVLIFGLLTVVTIASGEQFVHPVIGIIGFAAGLSFIAMDRVERKRKN